MFAQPRYRSVFVSVTLRTLSWIQVGVEGEEKLGCVNYVNSATGGDKMLHTHTHTSEVRVCLH